MYNKTRRAKSKSKTRKKLYLGGNNRQRRGNIFRKSIKSAFKDAKIIFRKTFKPFNWRTAQENANSRSKNYNAKIAEQKNKGYGKLNKHFKFTNNPTKQMSNTPQNVTIMNGNMPHPNNEINIINESDILSIKFE
jgi:hypothetical protein